MSKELLAEFQRDKVHTWFMSIKIKKQTSRRKQGHHLTTTILQSLRWRHYHGLKQPTTPGRPVVKEWQYRNPQLKASVFTQRTFPKRTSLLVSFSLCIHSFVFLTFLQCISPPLSSIILFQSPPVIPDLLVLSPPHLFSKKEPLLCSFLFQ